MRGRFACQQDKPLAMARDSIVRGLYRFQQRIGLTAPEFRAVIVFIGLLVTGSVIENWRSRAAPIDPAIYAESDAYFRERAVMAGLRATSDTSAAETDTSTVPLIAMDAEPAGGLPNPAPDNGRVDLNSADAHTLQRLPGIGPALAERIVTFRIRNGPFLFAEDLLMVRGIGKKTLERLAPLITVDGVPIPDSLGPLPQSD